MDESWPGRCKGTSKPNLTNPDETNQYVSFEDDRDEIESLRWEKSKKPETHRPMNPYSTARASRSKNFLCSVFVILSVGLSGSAHAVVTMDWATVGESGQRG